MVITLENAQSIEKAIFDLGEHGLYQIIGANSNGKSILIKSLSWLSTLKFKLEEKRKAFVRRGAPYALITIVNNGMVFVAKITIERNDCEFMLVRNNGEKIIRTFREKGIEELLDEFGFLTLYDEECCVQICETFGSMPFVNTPMKLQSKLVKKITTDSTAERFMENYKITHKLALDKSKECEKSLIQKRVERDALVDFPFLKLEELHSRMEEVYEILKYIVPIELEPIAIPPIINFIDVDIQLLEPIPVVNYIEPISLLEPIIDLLEDLEAMADNRCPTCGKKLINDECEEVAV